MKEANDEKSIKAFSFMIEALQKPGCPKQFIARSMMSNGTAQVVFMGNEKELSEFLHSL